MAGEGDFTIYVDRLTVGSCLAARRWPRRGARGPRRVIVLDPMPSGARRLLLAVWARLLGLAVEEAQFFAGHLRDDRGESVYRAARRESAQMAFRAAGDIVGRVPLLRRLNAAYGRETLRLALIKRVFPEIEAVLRRIWVARALDRPLGRTSRILLAAPPRFDGDLLTGAVPFTSVRFWGGWLSRALAWASALHGIATIVVKTARGTIAGRGAAIATSTMSPGVLSLQEDDLGLEPHVRNQPHWLVSNAPPPFRTYVWLNHDAHRAAIDAEVLERAGVRPLAESDVEAIARRVDHPLTRRITRDALACFGAALTAARSADRLALATAGKLLARARLAAALCRALDVRVFLNGESYLTDASAVHLVAPALGVPSVSYQYSNISFVSPTMMNTADLMLLFSVMYERNWSHEGIAPQAFAVLGYPRDSSFPVLRARAADVRERLGRAGARFVICYMDESVQHDRYGQVSVEEHEADIFTLLRALLEDPTLGVVIKSQFTRNSPSRMFGGRAELEAARASGRYVELCHGLHRNVAFPAEAALASDIAVGHAIGGTAVLEAALAGRRSLMLNPYAWWGSWDDLYGRADIVYPSLAAALEAIAALRAGDPARQGLGDWSAILPLFDPYRDGRSAARLRGLLECIVAGATAAGAAGQWLSPPAGVPVRAAAERRRA